MRTHIRAISSSRGAVLAEAIMATVVGGLLLSTVSAFYLGYIKIWQRETGRVGAVRRADFVLRRMQNEVRNAKGLTLSSEGNSLTVVLPKRCYDAEVGRDVNEFDSQGQLVDGAQVEYSFVPDGSGSEQGAYAIHRRVMLADGTVRSPELVAAHICPSLNPLSEGTSDPKPVFEYDAVRRTVTVTITAAEPMPSSATFSVREAGARCKRDGGALVRVATSDHPEGEIRCQICGGQAKPNAHVVTYQTQLMLRNE